MLPIGSSERGTAVRETRNRERPILETVGFLPGRQRRATSGCCPPHGPFETRDRRPPALRGGAGGDLPGDYVILVVIVAVPCERGGPRMTSGVASGFILLSLVPMTREAQREEGSARPRCENDGPLG